MPPGGLALWCELPAPLAEPLTVEAERLGVVVAPGPVFAAEGGLARFVRIPWTRPADELRTAVDTLARAWELTRARPTAAAPTGRVMIA